jgi:hypothetical protein
LAAEEINAAAGAIQCWSDLTISLTLSCLCSCGAPATHTEIKDDFDDSDMIAPRDNGSTSGVALALTGKAVRLLQ